MILSRRFLATGLLLATVITGAITGAIAGRSQQTATDPKPGRKGPQRVIPGDHGVGHMVPDMKLTDVDGKAFRLSEFQDRAAVVIAFTNTSCPVSKKYAPTLAALEKEFQDRNVVFVFVNPTSSDKPELVREAITTHRFQGHYVSDHDGYIATAVGATHTTDAIVLDASRTIVYRGAVDDQYGTSYTRDEPRETFLTDAITATLAGERPVVAATTAPGCPLDFEPAGTLLTSETYHNRISRIIQFHCLECHRDGGVAPFALSSYEEVKGQSGSVRRVIEEDIMPPWFAADPAEGTVSPFANDCSLAQADKTALLDWLNGGKPEGDPSDAPLPRSFHDGWQIGKPDLIVQLASPIAVKAGGTMPYQNVIVDTGLTETKYVKAVEVLPTAREVVHHVLVFVMPPGKRGAAGVVTEDDDEEDGTSGFFAAYAPGYDALVFNEGYGKVLPAGSRLKFQIHYTPNGTATKDQSMIGMIFLNEKPEYLVDVTGVAQPRLAIPPGAADHEVVANQPIPNDATILAFFPHMHLRGKAFRYEAILPDGRTQTLLDIPRYDFNWQLSYRFAEPVTLPAGSTLRATAIFDNSKDNPANPDPTRTVRWGPQTYDEMMIGYVEYYMADGSLGRGSRGGALRDRLSNLGSGNGIELLFKRMDSNSDGKVSGDELPTDQKDRLLRLDADKDGALSLEEAKRLTQIRKQND